MNGIAPASANAAPVPAGPPSNSNAGRGDEKASQHGRRALLVAGALGALILGGLLVDSMRSARQLATPQAPASTTPAPRSAPDPFADFEAKQRQEAARLEAQAKAQPPLTNSLTGSLTAAAPGAAPATQLPSEQEIRAQAKLDDLRRALAAMNSRGMVIASAQASASAAGLGGLSSASLSSPAASGSTSAPSPARPAEPGPAPRTAASAFVRELEGAAATAAIVGQSATRRREAGAGRREGERLLPAGSLLSAVMDIEINSDWGGRWRGMVTRDVYDLAQDTVLIPKGTRILGTVARPSAPVNEVINERMALAAQWLVLPNGARIDLARSATLDGSGIAALPGDVNHHYLATIGGVMAYAVIGGFGAARAARGIDGSGGEAVNAGTAAYAGRSAGAEIALGLAQIGQRVASRYLNLVPTITIKPGSPMTIFLDDELFLQPWAPIDEFAPSVVKPASP